MDITYSNTPRKYKPWQRITSLITLLLFFFQIPSVAFAQALANADIQVFFENNSQFERAISSSYQYQPAVHLNDVEENYFSISDFYKRLHSTYPEGLGAPNYVPISVGDITTFIPVYKGASYKEVGSPFVQSRYIRQQVMELLGRSLIDKEVFGSERNQLVALYDNAFTFAQSSNFEFGDVLTANRVNAPFNMIWPELRTIHGEQVLVPVLYLTEDMVKSRKVDRHITEFDGPLVDFKTISVTNTQIDFGRDAFVKVSNDLILEDGSLVSDNDMEIVAGGTLKLLSGQIDAGGNLKISAHGVDAQTLVHRYNLGNTTGTKYDVVADITASGDMVIRSYRDIHIQGSSFNAGGSMTLAADGSIRIESVELSTEEQSFNGRWLTTNTSVDYLQSSLTAEQTLELIANSDIQIDGAELVSNEGHIKLLAGMGISIENDFSSTHFVGKYHSGKKKIDVEAYQTVAIRAALDAGKGVTIHSEYGDINLRAVAINSSDGAKVSAQNGAVNLLIAKETDHYSYHSISKRMFNTRTVDMGHDIETAVYPTIIGGFQANALYGLNIEVEDDKSLTLQEQLDNLEQMPGMEWITEVRSRDDINWHEIELAYDKWSKTDTNLNAAAMALISVAVAVAMGPAFLGATIANAASAAAVQAGIVATGTASAQAIGLAAAAGVGAMTTQASLSLANGNSIGDTLENLAKTDSLKSTAIAMLSAGAVSGISGLDIFSPENITLTNGSVIAGELSIVQQVGQVLVTSAASASISTIISGGSLDGFEEAFISSLVTNAIHTIGKEVANEIGRLADSNPPKINEALRYISHAALGCGLGVAKGALNEDSDTGTDCASGAGGAVIGEAIAQGYTEAMMTDEQKALVLWLKSKGLYSEQELQNLTPEEVDEYVKLVANVGVGYQELKDLKDQGVDLAKLGAGLSAFVAGGNVQIASYTGENAAENNWFQLVVLAVRAGMVVYSLVEIYKATENTIEAYKAYIKASPDQKDEILKQLAKDLSIEVATTLTGTKLLKEIVDKAKEHDLDQKVIKVLDDFYENQTKGKPFNHGEKVESEMAGSQEFLSFETRPGLNTFIKEKDIQLRSDWDADRLYDDVLGAAKGDRPSPENYLSASAISSHLSKFVNGAVRIYKPRESGSIGPENDMFVFPRDEWDRLIESTGGDISLIDRKLGMGGYLIKNKAVLEVAQIDSPKVRLPSGNETGASQYWLPGGYTSGGVPEAVIDYPSEESISQRVNLSSILGG